FMLSCAVAGHAHPRASHSFPTRRSSDLGVSPFRGGRACARAGGTLRSGRRQAPALPLADAHIHDFGRVEFVMPGEGRGPELFSRSEEHTSELQSRENLVCRLLLEKKKKQ